MNNFVPKADGRGDMRPASEKFAWVANLLAQGFNAAQIANRGGISTRAAHYRIHMLRKEEEKVREEMTLHGLEYLSSAAPRKESPITTIPLNPIIPEKPARTSFFRGLSR